MSETAEPEFRVYAGQEIIELLRLHKPAVMTAVESAYRAHSDGKTVNPQSTFLRFPDRPADRIIALPASYETGTDGSVTGIKWVASFPANIHNGLARASAVLILNDETTGYPLACMEAGVISATRTAASAVCALQLLTQDEHAKRDISVIGAGAISTYLLSFLKESHVAPGRIVIFDLDQGRAHEFARMASQRLEVPISVAGSVEQAIRSGEVVVFTTTAGSPYVKDASLFGHCPIVLHLSLRDLAPEVILSAHNVVDDVAHCLRAATSVHLTELQVGHRDFVDGTLPDMLTGKARIPGQDRPIVFSPFGMGILDLAVARLVHSLLAESAMPVSGFFPRPGSTV